MKSKLNSLTIIFAIILSVPNLFPQSGEDDFTKMNFAESVTNRGTSAAAFLEIGIGARAEAMGSAFTAVANDASALYWNVAGISNFSNVLITASHTNWLAESKFQHLGLVLPLGDFKAFGLSLTMLDYMDKQPVRTLRYPEGTGEYYDASDLAIALSYAMNITGNFSFGITGKYIYQTIWHESASAFAADLGILYKTDLDGLSLGASISNFGNDMRLEGRDLIRPFDEDQQNYSNDKLNVILKTDEFSLPLLFRFGMAYEATLLSDHGFKIAADLIHPSNNVESMNIGIEYGFRNILFLRGGYQSLFDDKSEAGLTLGLGVRNPLSDFLDIEFNYAYSDWGKLKSVQRFSIDLRF